MWSEATTVVEADSKWAFLVLPHTLFLNEVNVHAVIDNMCMVIVALQIYHRRE